MNETPTARLITRLLLRVEGIELSLFGTLLRGSRCGSLLGMLGKLMWYSLILKLVCFVVVRLLFHSRARFHLIFGFCRIGGYDSSTVGYEVNYLLLLSTGVCEES